MFVIFAIVGLVWGVFILNNELRQLVIETLRSGAELPKEWARELFPSEKREYDLAYYGKQREEEVLANTLSVPLQPDRTFGQCNAEWNNMLIFGDNLQVMKTLLEQKVDGKLCNSDGTQGVRLIYIDPPFATRQEFRGSQEQKAYQDKIAGAEFLEFLRQRFILMHRLLADNGLIYIHLDYRKAHYAKVLLDEIFGEQNFMNEIAWCYSERELATRHWNRKHDVILVYGKNLKSDKHVFNWREAALEYSKGTVKKYEHIDENGRTFQIRGRNIKGSPWKGKHGVPLQVEKENPEWVYRDYFDTKEGIRPRDWWSDIPFLNRAAGDRWDYPSAKNPLLLDRIIRVCSNKGDLVLDAFAGSGTTLAVAERLDRRWIGIDCGKLSIYTIQKRMINLRTENGNKGGFLKPKFTLFNAGLYDFSKLKQLPWKDWRFFALRLFGCKDEPHTIGGLPLDGKLKGSSVIVFNHTVNAKKRIDEETIKDIHSAIGKRIGNKFFIIAPRGVFDFQQDYLDFDGVRYYALRIPYSIINEIHHREFTALKQPMDERSVNDTVNAVGFDFIHPPTIQWEVGITRPEGRLIEFAYLKVDQFESRTQLRGKEEKTGFETLSMIMFDLNYNGDVFDLKTVVYAEELQSNNWTALLPVEEVGMKMMVIFVDIYGNESCEIIDKTKIMKA